MLMRILISCSWKYFQNYKDFGDLILGIFSKEFNTFALKWVKEAQKLQLMQDIWIFLKKQPTFNGQAVASNHIQYNLQNLAQKHLIRSIHKFIMSFQGIRKIREIKRECASPLLLESYQLRNNSIVKPIQFNFDLNSSYFKNDLRITKDSEIKPEASPHHSRKNSFELLSSSKDKEKKILVGNFLRINFDGLKNGRPNRELKKLVKQSAMTERSMVAMSNPEDQSNQQLNKISLNTFALDFIVGKGGFGKVWKVFQKSTQKTYAMKEMKKVKIISKRSVQSVMNQKILLQNLKNPFLVNMYCSFQNRENLFLVMDYCNRGDLRYHLSNKRKFTEEETRFILACIVSCLEYMHSKKVIHRDLKPENLVFDNRGYVRVTDLGVSREVKPNNEQDTSGTPGYMAPEVICKMNHSFPVDYFALGVMAYEFMTGKRPYMGANRKQIREKILMKQVQLQQISPHGWSRESVDFVNRLIQRKPESRLGYTGIQQIKFHPFFKKIDWEKLRLKRIPPPFLPETIEQDYANYKQCISEDTQIQDMEEYKMILRHKDTQQAFTGYDSNITNQTLKKRSQSKQFQKYAHTVSVRRGRK